MIDSNFQVDELIHERGLRYGSPDRFMTQLAEVWSSIVGVKISPQRVAIMMLFFKLIRLWNNPSHEDTQQDIQGYLKIVEILKKQ